MPPSNADAHADALAPLATLGTSFFHDTVPLGGASFMPDAAGAPAFRPAPQRQQPLDTTAAPSSFMSQPLDTPAAPSSFMVPLTVTRAPGPGAAAAAIAAIAPEVASSSAPLDTSDGGGPLPSDDDDDVIDDDEDEFGSPGALAPMASEGTSFFGQRAPGRSGAMSGRLFSADESAFPDDDDDEEEGEDGGGGVGGAVPIAPTGIPGFLQPRALAQVRDCTQA